MRGNAVQVWIKGGSEAMQKVADTMDETGNRVDVVYSEFSSDIIKEIWMTGAGGHETVFFNPEASDEEDELMDERALLNELEGMWRE